MECHLLNFAQTVPELYVIVDKMAELFYQRKFSLRDKEQLEELLESQKYMKCCEILHKSTDLSWLQWQKQEGGVFLEYHEGTMFLCKQLLKKKGDDEYVGKGGISNYLQNYII